MVLYRFYLWNYIYVHHNFLYYSLPIYFLSHTFSISFVYYFKYKYSVDENNAMILLTCPVLIKYLPYVHYLEWEPFMYTLSISVVDGKRLHGRSRIRINGVARRRELLSLYALTPHDRSSSIIQELLKLQKWGIEADGEIVSY